MIPLAEEFRWTALTLKLFTPASPQECELFDVLEQTYRVAYSYVKRAGRLRDRFMIQEAAQEAAFCITQLIYLKLAEIQIKFPDTEERHKFYRMFVGFRLKDYFSYRSSSVVSYLRKRGLIQEFEELSDTALSRPDANTERLIALDHACRNQYERCVVQYYCMGNDRATIAEKLECTERRVKKTLRRIKTRLRYAN